MTALAARLRETCRREAQKIRLQHKNYERIISCRHTLVNFFAPYQGISFWQTCPKRHHNGSFLSGFFHKEKPPPFYCG